LPPNPRMRAADKSARMKDVGAWNEAALRRVSKGWTITVGRHYLSVSADL
jgi:hypothetical protein